MPVHVNSIGPYTFFDLVGAVYPRQEQIEIIERPGVDGSGARKTGARGKPFVMVSVSYHASFTAFYTALSNYKTLPGQNPQAIVRNDVPLGTFLVMNVVEAEPPQAIFNAAGSPGSQVRATVRWTLLG